MYIDVVTESHSWGDEKEEVPDRAEMEDVKDELRSLKRKMAALAGKLTSIEASLSSLDRSVSRQRTSLSTIKKDICAELEGGEWKRCIQDVVADAVRKLEITVDEMNKLDAGLVSNAVQSAMHSKRESKFDRGVHVGQSGGSDLNPASVTDRRRKTSKKTKQSVVKGTLKLNRDVHCRNASR